jgi:hypothetical protein
MSAIWLAVEERRRQQLAGQSCEFNRSTQHIG